MSFRKRHEREAMLRRETKKLGVKAFEVLDVDPSEAFWPEAGEVPMEQKVPSRSLWKCPVEEVGPLITKTCTVLDLNIGFVHRNCWH